MRRYRLAEPQTVPHLHLHGVTPAAHGLLDPGERESRSGGVHVAIDDSPQAGLRSRGRLDDPTAAEERRRHLFRPRRGWFRNLERDASHYLSANVYPWIPGLAWPYDRILRRTLSLSETEVDLVGLHPAFDGLRVLLVTDVHAGPFVSSRVLSETFDRLLALEADLVLLGGDLVTGRVADFEESVEAFRRLRAPLGVFAVFGNHDHYPGAPERLRDLVEGCGIAVLHNRSVTVERDGGGLSLAGVDDLLVGEPDLDASLRDLEPPVVLLCHNPDLLFDAARHGVALMLSGHTHAGQVRVPRLPVIVRQSKYRLDQGRYRTGGTDLVVSRGLGAVGIPLRVACPPEAVLLTLRRSPA